MAAQLLGRGHTGMPGPSLVCWLSILIRAASRCASIIEVSTDAQSADAPMWTGRSATNTAFCSLQYPAYMFDAQRLLQSYISSNISPVTELLQQIAMGSFKKRAPVGNRANQDL